MSIKKDIQYSKGERAAIVFLIILLLGAYAYHAYVKPELIFDKSTYCIEDLLVKKKILEQKEIRKKAADVLSYSKKNKIFYNPPPKYESFNPNNIDSLKWIQFGVKPWTISTIKKYQSKGGKFYKCEDLSKLYNLPDSVYQKLIPYCNIPKKKWPKRKSYPKFENSTKEKFRNKTKDSIKFKKRKVYTPIIVNLNTADTTSLQRLYGVGPVLSKRIVEYRNLLGGFHSIAQLAEVWGLEPIVIDDNKDKLLLNTAVSKLNINAPVDTLARHPYLKWPKAKVIANYRKQHGDFETISELKKVRVITDSIYNRLLPYLSIE